MARPNADAALHFALGALKPGDVPVGNHDLSNVQITLTFPAFAAVARATGSEGDGYDAADAAAPPFHPLAALLFIERCGVKLTPKKAIELWAECIRNSIDAGKVKIEELLPNEAATALAQVQAEQPPAEPVRKKTPAKRIGADEVHVAIKRLAKNR